MATINLELDQVRLRDVEIVLFVEPVIFEGSFRDVFNGFIYRNVGEE